MIYTIGQLAEIIDGDRGKNYPKQNEFHDNGYCLFLNTGNVTANGLVFFNNQFVTEEKDKQRIQRSKPEKYASVLSCLSKTLHAV